MLVRSFETVGIISFFLASYRIFFWIESQHALSSLSFFLVLVLSYWTGDFLSGLIHWLCDRFGNSNTPILGPLIIHPFRYHHADPQKIVRESVIENLGASAIAGCFFLLLFVLIEFDKFSYLQACMAQFYLWTVIFSVFSNLSHRWSHFSQRKKPFWLKWAQKTGLVISSEEHLKHHARPFRSHYCILCGWANPLTNRIPWEYIEALAVRIGISVDKG